MKIKLSEIESAGNVRIDFGDIQAMAASLTVNGQVEPIIVHSKNGNGTYIIDDGHRRVAAAKMLGIEDLDAIIKDAPEDRAAFQFVINEHRKNLTYSERAAALNQMVESGKTQADVARITGLSESEVSLALSTLKACPKLLDAVNTGALAPSAIEPLLSLPIEEQEALANTAIKEKTVRRVVALVKAYKSRKTLATSPVISTNDDNPFDVVVLEALRQARNTLASVAGFTISDSAKREMDEVLHTIYGLLDTIKEYNK